MGTQIAGTVGGTQGILPRPFPPKKTDPMDCRTFQKQHVAFIDDTLSAVDMVVMHQHIAECEQCARHDATERRALLLFRNLPRVVPSPTFRSRLDDRLREAKLSGRPISTGNSHIPVAVAATIAILAGAWTATFVTRTLTQQEQLALAPVVAMIPEPASPLANPALVASVSTGMPVWPVALLAEQAPMHFANSEFQLTSFNR